MSVMPWERPEMPSPRRSNTELAGSASASSRDNTNTNTKTNTSGTEAALLSLQGSTCEVPDARAGVPSPHSSQERRPYNHRAQDVLSVRDETPSSPSTPIRARVTPSRRGSPSKSADGSGSPVVNNGRSTSWASVIGTPLATGSTSVIGAPPVFDQHHRAKMNGNERGEAAGGVFGLEIHKVLGRNGSVRPCMTGTGRMVYSSGSTCICSATSPSSSQAPASTIMYRGHDKELVRQMCLHSDGDTVATSDTSGS